MKELICINCPRGCRLKVDDDMKVTGNFCPRGEKYAIAELTHPTRTLTTTVKTDSETNSRCPVKSKEPLPKELIFEAMEVINKIVIKLPVKIGDVVMHNICKTNIDIVATKDIDK